MFRSRRWKRPTPSGKRSKLTDKKCRRPRVHDEEEAPIAKVIGASVLGQAIVYRTIAAVSLK